MIRISKLINKNEGYQDLLQKQQPLLMKRELFIRSLNQ